MSGIERHPRMLVSTEGLEGSGKTRFAVESTPRPLAYLDFDFGLEGIDPKLLHGIDRKSYDLMAATGGTDAQIQANAAAVMRRFISDFREAIAKQVRTIVADTFTAAWAGQRLARKDEDRYIVYEEEFKSLIRAAYVSPYTNVILIHHMKPDWKRDSSGKSYKANTFSRDGLDGILTMVQLGIRQRFVHPTMPGEQGRFEMDILKCRDNVALVGQTFPAMDFLTLCGLVRPDVEWK